MGLVGRGSEGSPLPLLTYRQLTVAGEKGPGVFTHPSGSLAINADQGRRDIFFNNIATSKSLPQLLQITLDPYPYMQPQLKSLGYKKDLKVKGRLAGKRRGQREWAGTRGDGVDMVRTRYSCMKML